MELANTPSHFLLAVQIGINLVVILAGSLGGRTLADHVAVYIAFFPVFEPYSQAIALALVVLSITYFSLVIGQLVPKRLAARYPETVATIVAIPLRWLSKISSPMIRLLNISADAVGYLFGKQQTQETLVTEEEIKTLVQQGTEAGVFEESEQEMMEAVLRLGDKPLGRSYAQNKDCVDRSWRLHGTDSRENRSKWTFAVSSSNRYSR